ncbi:MAG: TolC family protein [Magnetococcales bacterium]|nr:TolC family protein [Magnetococcales bacterium]
MTPLKETFRNFPRPALLALLGLTLAGCSITPDPISRDLARERAQAKLVEMFSEQDLVSAPLSLHDAIARSIKFNLGSRVYMMEKALAHDQLDAAEHNLLPSLAASAGYSHRSNDALSTSEATSTGVESVDPSLSSERNRFLSDMRLAWNVLDFGVSYYSAKQQADQIFIVEEQRRKALQNLMEEVRTAYWRAWNAQRLLPRVDGLLAEVYPALKRSREMEKKQSQSPDKALEFQQGLLQTLQQLLSLRRDQMLARQELASLMNLRPGVAFKLEPGQADPLPLPEDDLEMMKLEVMALTLRPEMRENQYQERIDGFEIRKTLLRLLPGIELSLAGNYDSNKFQVNQSWADAGVNIAWNVLSLLSGPTMLQMAENQKELNEMRGLVTAMAVVTQLHLAERSSRLLEEEYQVARDLYQVHQRRAKHAQAAAKAGKTHPMAEIQRKMENISAQMKTGAVYAEFQGSVGRLYHSLGIDPLPLEIAGNDLQTLTAAVQQRQGELPDLLRSFPLQEEGGEINLEPAESGMTAEEDGTMAEKEDSEVK